MMTGKPIRYLIAVATTAVLVILATAPAFAQAAGPSAGGAPRTHDGFSNPVLLTFVVALPVVLFLTILVLTYRGSRGSPTDRR